MANKIYKCNTITIIFLLFTVFFNIVLMSADSAVSAAESGPLLPRSRHLLHVLRVHCQKVGLLDSRER